MKGTRPPFGANWSVFGLGSAVGVACAYFLAARLGLALLTDDVAVFWPASGIAVGILVMLGRRARASVVIGVIAATVLANLMGDRSLWTSVLKGFCNAGEAVLTAWLIEQWFGRAFVFDDVSRVLGFLGAAGLGAATSAVGGAATMTLLHTTEPYWDVWRAWFLSDGIGIVVVAPVVIGLGQLWRERPSRGELTTGVGLLAVMAFLATHMANQPTDSWLSFSPGCVELPLLLWLAARYRPAFAIAAAFVLSIAIICATNFGIGRFGDVTILLAQRAQGAQLTVATITAFTLVLVALFAERRRKEAALRLALDGAELGAFNADLATGHFECDARAAGMHGCNAVPNTLREVRRFVHGDDLKRIDEALAKSPNTGGFWSTEYRVMPPPNHAHAGETRWVAVESSVVCNSQGLPERLLGVTRDITDRKLAEQALANSSAQLELASKIARVGSFTICLANGRVRLSPGCAALYGLPEGTVDLSRDDARARIHPEDRARVGALHNQALIARKGEIIAQFRIVRADNHEVRWLETRSLIDYGEDRRPLGMIGVSIDVTERKQAEDHKSLLVAELDHRVKNTLACVAAIAEQTRTTSNSIDEFLEVLRGRIRSLANTHGLLSDNRWQGVDLAELVSGELAPCMRDGNTFICGPAVDVTADAVQTVAIVLHELTTNAAKYGALSNGGGRISVRWHWQPDAGLHEGLVLEWCETGGPLVVTPSVPGYGTSVIRGLIPYELGGTVAYDLTPAGVRCKLGVPARWLRKKTGQRDALDGAAHHRLTS